jgi:DNA polymerase III subunit epsilon
VPDSKLSGVPPTVGCVNDLDAAAYAVPSWGPVWTPGVPPPQAWPTVAPWPAPSLTRLEYVVVDVETTGWSPDEARITEIGAVRMRAGRILGEFSTLVDPAMPIPPDIEALTGISSQMVATAPEPAQVLPAWLRFAQGGVLTAHNAPFDLSFLTAACRSCGLPWPDFAVLDTVAVARQALVPGEVPDCKLGTLATFFETPAVPSHRALADARATAAVLDVLITRLALLGIRTLDDLNDWLAIP